MWAFEKRQRAWGEKNNNNNYHLKSEFAKGRPRAGAVAERACLHSRRVTAWQGPARPGAASSVMSCESVLCITSAADLMFISKQQL